MEQRARPRFFDSRAAYMMFVTTTTEKSEVAARIAREAFLVAPDPMPSACSTPVWATPPYWPT